MRRPHMAERKTNAEKGGDAERKRLCPSCGSESRVVQTRIRPPWIFLGCDKDCGFNKRTR